jgi:hypothetical protein
VWRSTDQREARIVGGMHLRAFNLAGEKLGVEVS